jgi:hypothetical protein
VFGPELLTRPSGAIVPFCTAYRGASSARDGYVMSILLRSFLPRLTILLIALTAVIVAPVQRATSAAVSAAAARISMQVEAAATPARWAGVTMPGVPGDLTGFHQLAVDLGHPHGVGMWYLAWSWRSPFPAADAARVASHGAVPEITWEPWDPFAGVDQPTYSLSRIRGGAFDSYLRSWAADIKAYGQPVRLRFAHEMNGDWYPWSEGVNGNAAGSYVAAWRHVRAVFDRLRVTNVTWIWSPTAPYPGTTPLAGLFPGDRWIDEVGLDGYNWSTLLPGTTWNSFAGVFSAGYREVTALSTRPVSIGEMGCPEVGGDKAAWIRDMWRTLATWPRLRGLVWFQYDKETDWRVDSSEAALAAYRDGLPGFLAG